MTEQMLRQYTVLVEYLGKTLGPDYEVVLHEILPENSRVAAIANGSISGRSVGAPITNAALRMIMQKQYETSDYNLNYTGQLANGKTIRSSTMFIKDGGKLVGLLCINFDDSRFHEISDAILKLIHPDDFVHHRSLHHERADRADGCLDPDHAGVRDPPVHRVEQQKAPRGGVLQNIRARLHHAREKAIFARHPRLSDALCARPRGVRARRRPDLYRRARRQLRRGAVHPDLGHS